MKYNNVIEVHYNWHTHPDHGCDWGFYRIGERYARFQGGYVRCEDIVIDFEDGLHAVFYFEDGTAETQWNINKIIEAEHDVYHAAKEHKGDREANQLPQPSANKEEVQE